MPDYTVAVVADTHVPDRVGELHPHLLPSLREIRPDIVLHAGDICAPDVLAQLGRIAPVEAVRGNRDWAFVSALPQLRRLAINGVKITLQHGHGTFGDYLADKMAYLRQGYHFERYAKIVRRAVDGAQVLVFGHTHHAECVWENGVLLFNPGSASMPPNRQGTPSFGVLQIGEDGKISAEIHPLGALRWDGRRWADSGQMSPNSVNAK